MKSTGMESPIGGSHISPTRIFKGRQDLVENKPKNVSVYEVNRVMISVV